MARRMGKKEGRQTAAFLIHFLSLAQNFAGSAQSPSAGLEI